MSLKIRSRSSKSNHSLFIVHNKTIYTSTGRFTCCLNMVFNLKIIKMSPELFARGYTESAVDQTDHFAEAFVRENVASGYDVVTTL